MCGEDQLEVLCFFEFLLHLLDLADNDLLQGGSLDHCGRMRTWGMRTCGLIAISGLLLFGQLQCPTLECQLFGVKHIPKRVSGRDQTR